MPISDEELKRLDAFWVESLYQDKSFDNHADSLQDCVEKMKDSDHIRELMEEVVGRPGAPIRCIFAELTHAFCNGFYWGRQFEKLEQLRAMFVGKDDRE